MNSVPPPIPDLNPLAEPAGATRRKDHLLELLVFLGIFAPRMLSSFFITGQAAVGFTAAAILTILQDLALVGLILYFLRRNGEPRRLIGWRVKNGWREVGLALALCLPYFILIGLMQWLLYLAQGRGASSTLPAYLIPRGGAELLLSALLASVVAVAEETIFRGYLLLRLKNIGCGTATAVLLSALLFAAAHGYYSVSGKIVVGVIGLIFSLMALWRRSLVMPIVIHFLEDFLGLLLVSLARHKMM